jgi:hypothetical protein
MRLGYWIGRLLRCFLVAWGMVAVVAIVTDAVGWRPLPTSVLSPMIPGLAIALFGPPAVEPGPVSRPRRPGARRCSW